MIGFLIFVLAGCVFLGIAVYAFFARRPVGFFANVKMFEVTDVKKYNRAVAKLFFVYGLLLVPLGIPALLSQKGPWVILSILGIVVLSIAVMVVYVTVIERKYRK